MGKELFRRLPAVDSILRDEYISVLLKNNPRRVVVEAVRAAIQEERERIKSSGTPDYRFNMGGFRERVGEEVKKTGFSLRRVVNATGVVLHTNLGRDPIARSAVENLLDISKGYCNLEFDLEKGERGERHSHLEPILCRVTGAEAAMAVNNNAAAVLLVLNTLAEGKEVIVSRGELVEIGGSFRIPDIMRKSGGKLVEVGTTNKTRVKDYEGALTGETALILKVHRSNFEMIGFTADVPIQDLAELGKRHGIPVMNDLGSGSLIDLSRYWGLSLFTATPPHSPSYQGGDKRGGRMGTVPVKKEPTVQDAVRSGADIVTFSGDKLLGGPQAGMMLGKKEFVERIKRNPLARAVRIDKLTAAALEATLRIYMDERKAVQEIPVLRMLTAPLSELSRKARRLCNKLSAVSGGRFEIKVRDGVSMVGGGALPVQELPTRLLAVKPMDVSPNELERRMRMNEVPIISRIERDEVMLDMRTLVEGDAETITEFFRKAEAR